MNRKWKVAILIVGLVLCIGAIVSASNTTINAIEEINAFQGEMSKLLYEIQMTVTELRYHNSVREMGGKTDDATFLLLNRTLKTSVRSGLVLVEKIDTDILDGLSHALMFRKVDPAWTGIAKQYRNVSLHADAMREALEFIDELGDGISSVEKAAIDALVEVVRSVANMYSIGTRY